MMRCAWAVQIRDSTCKPAISTRRQEWSRFITRIAADVLASSSHIDDTPVLVIGTELRRPHLSVLPRPNPRGLVMVTTHHARIQASDSP